MNKAGLSAFLAAVLLNGACSAACSATHHAADVRATHELHRTTVGTVQKDIHIGMAAADVAGILKYLRRQSPRCRTWNTT